VLLFSWEELWGRHVPGGYRVLFVEPVHNICFSGCLFRPVGSHLYLTLEEFDKWLLRETSHISATNIFTNQEVNLTAWQMFMFCFDGWFGRNLDHNLLFDTIDPDLSLEARYDNYKNVIDFLATDHKNVFKIWQEDMYFVKYFSHWIGDLVVENGC